MGGYTTGEWNGFETINFTFDGKNAIIVLPKEPKSGKKWLFKTEYFGAFPNFEIEMLHRGYALAHVDNETRWCLQSDTIRQGAFAKYLHDEFDFAKKCLPVGMSCGGMQAVYFAARYPEMTAAIYIDAPVLNLLSCPCGVGLAHNELYDEFVGATGQTVSEMINYRNHPIDHVDELINAKIPVFLICGGDDHCVPYLENGKVLYDKYIAAGGDIWQIVKPGVDHNPHGLDDPTPLIEFVEKYY